MQEPDRVIPQRELRNNVSAVLREVERGAHLRITVEGRPVADLIPISRRRRFVPWAGVQRILDEAPLDPGFRKDILSVLGDTIDELWPDSSTPRS
jgi:prevent-host-death family protein